MSTPTLADRLIVTGTLLIAAAVIVLGVWRYQTKDIVPLSTNVYCSGGCR